MFKKLKDKISEEVTKAQAQAGQYLDNLVTTAQQSTSGAIANEAGNGNIDETEKPAAEGGQDLLGSIEEETQEQASVLDGKSPEESLAKEYKEPNHLGPFSLVDLDENETRDEPQLAPAANSPQTGLHSQEMVSTPNLDDSYFSSSLHFASSPTSSFSPQSDAESEYDGDSQSHSINLELVNKDQLYSLLVKLRDKGKKYRSRYKEVVKAYRTLGDEREKMKRVLTETQDRALRRISELKEQCTLEQEAKRHLEENLRVILEEKDANIEALQTKVSYYKGRTSESLESEYEAEKARELKAEGEVAQLQEKIDRLESVLSRCKETLRTNKEKVTQLTRDNEELGSLKEAHDRLSKQTASLKQVHEESVLNMAETKKRLHEELESKSLEINRAKEQLDTLTIEKVAAEEAAKLHRETCQGLEEKIVQIEKTAEEDRSNLLQELSRGKVASIHLIKEDSDKKIQSIEDEWKKQCKNLLKEKDDLFSKLSELQSNNVQSQIIEARSQNEQLKSEIAECQKKLKKTIEELNSSEETRAKETDQLKSLLDPEKQSESFKETIEQLNQRCQALDEIKESLQKKEELLEKAQIKTNEAKNEMESLRKQLEEKDRLMGEFKKIQGQSQSTEDAIKTDFIRLQEEYSANSSAFETQNDKWLSLNEEYVQATAQIEVLNKELASIRKNLEVEGKAKREMESVAEKLQEEANDLKQLVEKVSTQNVDSENRLKTLESEIKLLTDENDNLRQEQVSFETKDVEMKSYLDRIESLNVEIVNLNNDISSLRISAETVQQKITQMDTSLREKETKCSALQLSLEEREKAVQVYEKTCCDERETSARLAKAKEELEERLKSTEADLKEKTNLIVSTKAEMDNIKETVERLEANCAEKEAIISQLNSSGSTEVSTLRQSLSAANEKAAQLQEHIRSLEDDCVKASTLVESLQKELNLKKSLDDDLVIISKERDSFREQLNLIQSELNSNAKQLASVEEERLRVVNLLEEKEKASTETATELEKHRVTEEKMKKVFKKYKDVVEKEKEKKEKELQGLAEKHESDVIRLQSEIAEKESWGQKERESAAKRVEAIETELKESETALNLHKQSTDGLTEKNAELWQQIESERQLNGDLSGQLNLLREAERKGSQDYSHLISGLEDRLKEKETTIASLEESLRVQATNLGETEKTCREQESAKESLNNTCLELEKRVKELQETVEELKTLHENSNVCSTELESARKDLDAKSSQIKELRLENQRFEKRLKAEIEELREGKEKLADEYRNKLKVLESKSELEQINTKLEEKVASLQSLLKESKKTNTLLEKSSKEMTAQYLNEIQSLKIKEQEAKAAKEATVEKLYKQLELREAQLDENLMVSESQQTSTIHELTETKSQLSKIVPKLEEAEAENEHLRGELEGLMTEIGELKGNLEKRAENSQALEAMAHKINLLEAKLSEKESEMEACVDKFHSKEDKLIYEQKQELAALETEVTEKNTALEEVHDYYQERLREKEGELKALHEEFGSSSVNEHSYQVKAMQKSLLQYQEENLRLKELLGIRTNSVPPKFQIIPMVNMPEPTEYEYLRNILFEFMMGREPLTLAKVIAAVVRFSNDQTEQVLRRQEAILSSTVTRPLKQL